MFFNADDALAYDATRWDRVRWSLRADASPGVRTAELEFADTLRGIARDGGASDVDADRAGDLARTFAGEVFARVCADPDAVEGGARWAARAQSVVDEVPEFDSLRAAVDGDADLGALATKHLLDAVAGKLPGLLASDDDADADGDGDGDGSPGNGRARAAFRAAVRRAIESATGEVTDAREALEGLAPGMGSSPTTRDAADTTRLTLAEMLLKNPEFREVLRRAGKLRRMATATAKVRGRGVGTVVGLERGADLGRVLPSQLARLRHPRLRALAYKDIAERALVQYRVEGHEPQGRGPIVVLVDESASMGGNPQTWAKAAVIAAIRQGQAERRPVALAYFDTRILSAFMMDADGTVRAASRVAPAVAGDVFGTVADLVRDALTRGVAGGTDFSAPFQWALSVLEEGDDRADVVILTDGLASADEDTTARLDAQRARGTRVYALTVGGGEVSTGLAPLCDEVIALDRVPEDAIADRLAGAVPVAP